MTPSIYFRLTPAEKRRRSQLKTVFRSASDLPLKVQEVHSYSNPKIIIQDRYVSRGKKTIVKTRSLNCISRNKQTSVCRHKFLHIQQDKNNHEIMHCSKCGRLWIESYPVIEKVIPPPETIDQLEHYIDTDLKYKEFGDMGEAGV